MSYKVRFEIEFPWMADEAEDAEWLLVRRYGLQNVTHNRCPRLYTGRRWKRLSVKPLTRPLHLRKS